MLGSGMGFSIKKALLGLLILLILVCSFLNMNMNMNICSIEQYIDICQNHCLKREILKQEPQKL